MKSKTGTIVSWVDSERLSINYKQQSEKWKLLIRSFRSPSFYSESNKKKSDYENKVLGLVNFNVKDRTEQMWVWASSFIISQS